MTSPFKPFPGAPDGSWVTDEGWLVVGDEAWTAEEWKSFERQRPLKDTDDERVMHRRRQWRESKRRHRDVA